MNPWPDRGPLTSKSASPMTAELLATSLGRCQAGTRCNFVLASASTAQVTNARDSGGSRPLSTGPEYSRGVQEFQRRVQDEERQPDHSEEIHDQR
jgi:hypothetical protein